MKTKQEPIVCFIVDILDSILYVNMMKLIIFIELVLWIAVVVASDDQQTVPGIEIKTVDSESRELQVDEYLILIPKITDVLKQLKVEKMVLFELSEVKSGQIKIESDTDIRWLAEVEIIAPMQQRILCHLEIFEQLVYRFATIACDERTYIIEKGVQNKNK